MTTAWETKTVKNDRSFVLSIIFELKHPSTLDKAVFLATLKYGEDWVHFVKK